MKPRLAWLVIGIVVGVAVTGGAWATGRLSGTIECTTQFVYRTPDGGGEREINASYASHGKTTCTVRLR